VRQGDHSYRNRHAWTAVRLVVAAVVIVLSPVPTCALASTLTEHMELTCTQEQLATLRCNYRLIDGGELTSSVAEFNGQAIVGQTVATYPAADSITAVMLLVDTSDPARQPVIQRVREHIATLLSNAQDHQHFGLATFDTDLYLLADIATPLDELRDAAGTLVAKGKTTELYRNVLGAVGLLGRENGVTRRALIVMSDGLAEDYAYHHEDVVNLARERHVTIHSIGYPRSVAQSVALQTMRRLSDETGGLYVQSDHVDFSLPDGILARMLEATDAGGVLEFDLGLLIEAGVSGTFDLPLAFQTTKQSFIVLAPVRTSPPTAATSTTAVTQSAVADMPQSNFEFDLRRSPVVVTSPTTGWPWFVILGVLIIISVAAVLFAITRVRRTLVSTPPARDISPTPLAYLVMHDAEESRFVINKTPWRIGRGRNNDLPISDHSVSRLHAEIRSNEQGQLLLRDLESLNGVFVNENRIDSIQLREGDAMDIGDVRMHFTMHHEDYASESPTVLVGTYAPL
jgi:hypothetical protein